MKYILESGHLLLCRLHFYWGIYINWQAISNEH